MKRLFLHKRSGFIRDTTWSPAIHKHTACRAYCLAYCPLLIMMPSITLSILCEHTVKYAAKRNCTPTTQHAAKHTAPQLEPAATHHRRLGPCVLFLFRAHLRCASPQCPVAPHHPACQLALVVLLWLGVFAMALRHNCAPPRRHLRRYRPHRRRQCLDRSSSF